MRILEIYKSFFKELDDTIFKETTKGKITSLALKVIGALFLLYGASFTLGAVTALSVGELSLGKLICGVALLILGYDFAETGHSIRQFADSKIIKGVSLLWEGVKNALDMKEIEVFPLKAKLIVHTRDTIFFSRLFKLIDKANKIDRDIAV